MGINIANEKEYGASIRDLFPKGEYWDRQFSDPESDVNLFCKAKTQEIINFRKRMNDLLAESDYKTAVETIGDWERVLLEYTNVQIPIEERREILSIKNISIINKMVIADIAQKYGLSLVDIVFPFKPSFFGFAEFGHSIFSRPAFFSVFYIITIFQNDELKNEAKKRINTVINNSSFGYGCFGTGQFFNMSYFNKNYTTRIFLGMRSLDDFEHEVENKLLSGNIAYFHYKL
jgi:hypothetical protein